MSCLLRVWRLIVCTVRGHRPMSCINGAAWFMFFTFNSFAVFNGKKEKYIKLIVCRECGALYAEASDNKPIDSAKFLPDDDAMQQHRDMYGV